MTTQQQQGQRVRDKQTEEQRVAQAALDDALGVRLPAKKRRRILARIARGKSK